MFCGAPWASMAILAPYFLHISIISDWGVVDFRKKSRASTQPGILRDSGGFTAVGCSDGWDGWDGWGGWGGCREGMYTYLGT